MSSITTCRACNYTRQPTDNVPEWECPNCQKAYVKSALAIEQQGQTDRFQPTSFNTSSKPAIVNIGESSMEERKKWLDPDEPIKYMREHFSSIDQQYLQFESEFDASVFGDPVAMQTKWTKAATGSGGERYNRKLVEVAPHRLEFCSGKGMKFFGFIIVISGICEAMAISSQHLSTGNMIGALLVCSAFVIGGLAVICQSKSPIVFDKQQGFFWIGKKPPDNFGDNNSVKYFARLQDIHALQLIFRDSGRHSSRCFYELNLILNDGKRINVDIEHSAYYRNDNYNYTYFEPEKLRTDAVILARFLEKPLWDAIDMSRSIFEKFRQCGNRLNI